MAARCSWDWQFVAAPRSAARAVVDEVVAVERRSVREAAFALSSSARQHQVAAQAVQAVEAADSGPEIVSSVVPDADLAGAAGVTREPGLGRAHLAAHTDSAVEAEG